MDCANHTGTPAVAYCQNCGKPLCEQCARKGVALGSATQVFCDQCLAAWQQGANLGSAFGAAPPGTPNPGLAAVLGLIPGVGAMYNGQFFKGLIHVVIFAVLISLTDHYGIFGLFIAAWIFYQSFEAYHTARARRDGQPIPDPLGLNELAYWMHLSWVSKDPAAEYERRRAAAAAGQGANPGVSPGPASNPASNPAPNPGPGTGTYQPFGAPYQAPYTPPAGVPGTGPYSSPIPPIPPVPPAPPKPWKRGEPIGAIILIGLGLIFLLGEMGAITREVFRYGWPVILIAIGVWLIMCRVRDSRNDSGNDSGGDSK